MPKEKHLEPRGDIPTNGLELIKHLDEIIRSAPEEYRDKVVIHLDSDSDWLDAYYREGED